MSSLWLNRARVPIVPQTSTFLVWFGSLEKQCNFRLCTQKHLSRSRGRMPRCPQEHHLVWNIACCSRPSQIRKVWIKEGRNQRGVTNMDGGRAESFYKPWQTFCGLAMTKRNRKTFTSVRKAWTRRRERGIVWGAQKRNNSSNEMKLRKRKLRLNIKEEFANSEAYYTATRPLRGRDLSSSAQVI